MKNAGPSLAPTSCFHCLVVDRVGELFLTLIIRSVILLVDVARLEFAICRCALQAASMFLRLHAAPNILLCALTISDDPTSHFLRIAMNLGTDLVIVCEIIITSCTW